MKIYLALIVALFCSTATAGNVTQLFNDETRFELEGNTESGTVIFDTSILTSAASQHNSTTQIIINETGSFLLSYRARWFARHLNVRDEIDGEITVTTSLTVNGVQIVDSDETETITFRGSATHDQSVTVDLEVGDYIEFSVSSSAVDGLGAQIDIMPGDAHLTAEYNPVIGGLPSGSVDWGNCSELISSATETSSILQCYPSQALVIALCDSDLPICEFHQSNSLLIEKEQDSTAQATIKCCGLIE